MTGCTVYVKKKKRYIPFKPVWCKEKIHLEINNLVRYLSIKCDVIKKHNHTKHFMRTPRFSLCGIMGYMDNLTEHFDWLMLCFTRLMCSYKDLVENF